MTKLKIILIGSLIVMALVVTVQQQANAELTLREKLWVDNAVRKLKIDLNVCNSLLDDPKLKLTAVFPHMNRTIATSTCDDVMISIPTIFCNATNVADNTTTHELTHRYIQSGVCEDPLLSKYIGERNLWDKIQ